MASQFKIQVKNLCREMSGPPQILHFPDPTMVYKLFLAGKIIIYQDSGIENIRVIFAHQFQQTVVSGAFDINEINMYLKQA